MNDLFHRFSSKVSAWAGSPIAFVVSLCIIVGWIFTGPFFGYSDTWQLLINTGTTISTFMMVFLIQNTQNRDARATHLKLDELIRAVKGARRSIVDVEELTDRELELLQEEFRGVHNRAVKAIERRQAGKDK